MIIINNEDALRVKCDDVLPDEISSIISALESELSYANKLGKAGIGLAAPQIGIAKNAAIIRIGNDVNINLINAKILNKYDPFMFRQEGCLSFPGRVEDTIRFGEIHIISNAVGPSSFIVAGLPSIVCQHELDHLNSILFMDRASEKKIILKKSKLKPNDICDCGSKIKFKRCCGKI